MLLSICTLVGLVFYTATGAAWLDPVTGFVIAVFAINKGREAWHGELLENETKGEDQTHASRGDDPAAPVAQMP